MSTKKIYHERQSRQLCALHTLNNLFQAKQTYTKEQLDSISCNLSPTTWFNPHRSVMGLGNYDINVIMRALQLRDCEAHWFDKRKDPSCIDLDVIIGFILNVPSNYKIGIMSLPLWKRHWIALRCIEGVYYNLDSKLREPKAIGDEADLLAFLRLQLATEDHELFVIVDGAVVDAIQPGSNTNLPIQRTSRKWLKEESIEQPTTTTTTVQSEAETEMPAA